MGAWWSGSVGAFLAADRGGIVRHLTHAQATRFAGMQAQQIRAWDHQIDSLADALAVLPDPDRCRLLLEFPLLRLGVRIDAILLTPDMIFVLEFKEGEAFLAADLAQVDDYACDLFDFHAASRAHPITPILVAAHAAPPAPDAPLVLSLGVVPPQRSDAAGLGALLERLRGCAPAAARLDVDGWEHAAYRPVPAIIDAARTIYARHGVEDIRTARADARNLSDTTDALQRALAESRAAGRHAIAFVTGIPGAGKTMCGLDVAFSRETGAAFLTGNPTLVHVFREALARDAAGNGETIGAARRRMKSVIQPLPGFRDHYVSAPAEWPDATMVVIDEAQRCWSREQAIRATRDRPVKLTESEPAHLLDIMARRRDPVAIVCLVGNGQEIHTGEGGIAEWGEALTQRPDWQVWAAPGLLSGADLRQQLPDLPGLRIDEALHLSVPVRSLRNPRVADWVEAVLAFNPGRAAAIAREAPLPFHLTRSLREMRGFLRGATRGLRRAGLIASSGARRLRADGLGAELPHMDAAEVAHWFLDRWPEDVRASDALEVVGTEFSCQGLELDYVGLCWGGDMLPGVQGWHFRKFAGTDWQVVRNANSVAWRRNTYRVLLTRARYATVIWVPEGDASDRTRRPTEFDEIARFLRACGVGDVPASEAAPDARTRDLLDALA